MEIKEAERLVSELQKANQIVGFVKRGETLNKEKDFRNKRQKECNHRKGHVINSYIDNRGDLHTDVTVSGSKYNNYSIIKHTFFRGDTWVICPNCGKKWKPGDTDYEVALKFPTNNQASASIQMTVDVNQARQLTKES
jgi:hypothetical protein